MATNVVLIHGIGRFSEAQVVADVRSQLASAGVSVSLVEAVNWRRVAGDLSGDEPEFLDQVAALSRGVHGAVHLEPVPSVASALLITLLRVLRNVLLVLPLIVPFLLLFGVTGRYWFYVGMFVVGVTTLQVALAVTVARCTVAAALGSAMLPWLWLVTHACVVLPYLILRFFVGSVGCWTIGGIVLILVPLSFFVFEGLGCLSIFLPPLVYYAASHAVHVTLFDALLPIWRKFVERSGAALLLLAADVIRYLGDSKYRYAIQEQAISAIQRLSADKQLIVVAHSLGSVIAVDALFDIPRSQVNNVTLVTMGSPLKRLMHRLLPREYPPPAHLRSALQKRGAVRQWINIYRPLDMVGGSLFAGAVGDYSTRTWITGWIPPLHAHLDYWNDSRVLAAILDGLAARTDHGPTHPTYPKPLVNGPALAESASFQRGVYTWLVILAMAAYARLLLRLATIGWDQRFIACVACLGVLVFAFVAVPMTLAVVIPYLLSLAGIDRGGVDWVPALAKSQKVFEADVLPREPLFTSESSSEPARDALRHSSERKRSSDSHGGE